MVKLTVWSAKRLAQANSAVNDRLARGWRVLNVSTAGDGSVLVALYRDSSR
jgi:hypothetical protein